jgi:peptidoglycan hydrolase CwlO-like protein
MPCAHPRRTASAVLFSTLVALASLALVNHARPSGADSIADLKAQASTIAQQLVQQQLEIGAYQQQYSVLSARVSTDSQTVAQTDAQITADQQQINAKTGAVRNQAISSYMNYGSGGGSPASNLFNGNQESVQAANEYSAIAVGNITTAVDQLHTAEVTLEAHQAALHQQEAQDQADQARQGAALGQANSTAAHLASLQSEVTGQLATAVAQQQAAQAVSAASAVAAARRASLDHPGGSRAPTSAPAPGPTAAVPVSGGSDPALNPFLQCVVQAESGGNYGAVSPDGQYMGAFQFSQSTWNGAAQAAGRPDLIGVPPNLASKADQDTLAVVLYSLDGSQPWLGDRCSG